MRWQTCGLTMSRCAAAGFGNMSSFISCLLYTSLHHALNSHNRFSSLKHVLFFLCFTIQYQMCIRDRLGMVRSVDVARYMEVSKPSVCYAVGTLREGGFLTTDENHYLHLTDLGQEVAEKIYERHCFLTKQLISIGVDPETGIPLNNEMINTMIPIQTRNTFFWNDAFKGLNWILVKHTLSRYLSLFITLFIHSHLHGGLNHIQRIHNRCCQHSWCSTNKKLLRKRHLKSQSSRPHRTSFVCSVATLPNST